FEAVLANANIGKSPRQPELRDKGREDLAGIAIRCVERRCNRLLSSFRGRSVVTEHARHHDCRTEIVRNVAGAPEYMTNGVARAHRHPRLQPEGRQPGAQLTVESRLLVVRIALGASETII